MIRVRDIITDRSGQFDSDAGRGLWTRGLCPAARGFARLGALVARCRGCHGRGLSIRGVAIATALLATITSTLRVYPHQLAYFNELAGGPPGGYRHLLGTNLELGQDLLALRQIDFGPDATVRINVFGVADCDPPNSRYIDLRTVAEEFAPGDDSPIQGPQLHTPADGPDKDDGVLVLGTRALMRPELDPVRHQILREAERVGYTLFVLHNFPHGPPVMQH